MRFSSLRLKSYNVKLYKNILYLKHYRELKILDRSNLQFTQMCSDLGQSHEYWCHCFSGLYFILIYTLSYK